MNFSIISLKYCVYLEFRNIHSAAWFNYELINKRKRNVFTMYSINLEIQYTEKKCMYSNM